MAHSVVYVLTNPAMPDLVKIGMTDNEDTKVRLQQLYGTGVPFPFKLEFACRVPNPAEVEQALHTAFGPQRVNPRREFFKIDAAQAVASASCMFKMQRSNCHRGRPSWNAKKKRPASSSFRRVARTSIFRKWALLSDRY